MRRWVPRLSIFPPQGTRAIILRPESTIDPIRYPLGYVPLDGSEPIDAVYTLIKGGNFVAPLNSIEAIHKVYVGARSLCQSEYPIIAAQDMATLQLHQKELASRVLIRRDFWALDDFNDSELNKSYGIQNVYFDNFKWSQVLWKRFQLFVEEYFPCADHTHLLYSEYMSLIKSFSVFEQGIHAHPLLPRSIKLHPPFGVPVPAKISLEPLLLYKQWLSNFRSPLMVNKALVVNAGSGLAAFTTKLCHVPMVRGSDPRPRAVASCRNDAKTDKRLQNVSFQVSEMLISPSIADNSISTNQKYDLIVFYPDESIISLFAGDAMEGFAPSSTGYIGDFEQFFERVGNFLTDSGVIAICTTNIHSILKPHEPHPVEYEVKVNRRFVILDYYDAPIKYRSGLFTASYTATSAESVQLRSKLRSELWILHKIESITHFGFIHGIPGAKPPVSAQRWKSKKAVMERQRHLKNHAELMGVSWSEYKNRLITMLQEQSDTPEDDVAEGVRMALDPSYPQELANRARASMEEQHRLEELFNREAAQNFLDLSPREAFDAKHF